MRPGSLEGGLFTSPGKEYAETATITTREREKESKTMKAEDLRKYAEYPYGNGEGSRVLGSLNDWYMKACIRKIDRTMKWEAKYGGISTTVIFSEFFFNLHDADKEYLRTHYSNLGYHTSKHQGSLGISWAEKRPGWF